MKNLVIVLPLLLLSYLLPAQSEGARTVLSASFGNQVPGIGLTRIAANGSFNSFGLGFSAQRTTGTSALDAGNMQLQWTKAYAFLGQPGAPAWIRPYMGHSLVLTGSNSTTRPLFSTEFPISHSSIGGGLQLNTGIYGFWGSKFFWRLDAGLTALEINQSYTRSHNPSLNLEQQRVQSTRMGLFPRALPSLSLHAGIRL